MRPTLKTLALAVLAVCLLVLNLLDPGVAPGGTAPTRIISPVSGSDATRIELSTAIDKIVFEKDEQTGRWAISSPIVHPADQALVKSVLQSFRSETPLDVRVDEGNLAAYGLDAAFGIVVEIWAGDQMPEVSLTVGADAPGGSSFVRLSGDVSVYRARVGGRSRFDRSAAEWRNRVVLDFEEEDVQGISIKPPAGDEVHLSRSPVVTEADELGLWVIEPDPGWNLGAPALRGLVASLGRLRAREILADDFDGGFSPPAVEITVVASDGTETVMAVGSLLKDGSAYVRVTGGEAVYAVPVEPLQRFLDLDQGPREDRTIFEVARADMARMIYWEGRTSVEIAPDPSTGVWRPVAEGAASVDVAEIEWALGQLARLRSDGKAEGMSLAGAGVVPPNMVFEMQRQDGSHEAIYVGRSSVIEGRDFYFVARQNTREVHLILADRIHRLRQAFGVR
jgi:hypothetical protein